VTALTLNRLAQRDIETVIDNVVGNKLIPASVRQDIIERTDGIPLFVEEMTKAVLEAGSERAAQQTVGSFPSPALAVPASLQASLMARLDRLGAAKEVAQVGATIGREFSHTLLSAVVSKPEPALASALDRLIAAGLLFRQGVPPHASYLFKHALVQEAAYGTLLREPRRALHARITETLESQFTDIAENQPELLARHCTEAGLSEKAAVSWGKAGQRSVERSALAEAAEQLTRALNQIASLPERPDLRREQIKLQVALIHPLQHIKGYAAPETRAATMRARSFIERAESLGEPPEDPLLLFSVLYGFWVTNQTAFNGDVICKLASEFLERAERQEATFPRVIAHRLMGVSLLQTGDIEQARLQLDRAISLYNPAEHRALALRFGIDVRVAAFYFRSWTMWMLGYPDAALDDVARAVKDAREIGQVGTLMYALTWTSMIQIYCGKYAAAEAQAKEHAALANEKGSSYWTAAGMCNEGLLLYHSGRASDAVQILNLAIASWRSTGATLFTPTQLMWRLPGMANLVNSMTPTVYRERQ